MAARVESAIAGWGYRGPRAGRRDGRQGTFMRLRADTHGNWRPPQLCSHGQKTAGVADCSTNWPIEEQSLTQHDAAEAGQPVDQVCGTDDSIDEVEAGKWNLCERF